ncbi:MAG: asparagine synthase (glutamine-hydrolyzing) [Gammaproteobacteria bacterium]
MVRQLHHRGPDGTGYYKDDSVGLGHARLSIIDLEGGAQPIHNEDKTVWVVFNGEIFNYLELREDLVARGHTFYTYTDTEVLVHLYEEYSDQFIHHLNGQFGIAIWDTVRKRLILARDRAGILPLFYSVNNGRLVFASEIKAILTTFDAAPEMNSGALDQLMTFWAPVSPDTLFKGIEEVRPGELVIAEKGRIHRHIYWDWLFPMDGDYRSGTDAELAEELLSLLVDAIRIRLRADVPVGAYLSGGLDSSALVALIHHYGDASLRTFSISFEDGDMDESVFQRRMIDHFNTDHSSIHCETSAVGEAFYNTIYHTEMPVLRTAPVPMGMLSCLVREKNFKVVLTGEGSDEVLGGYDIFKEGKIRQFWSKNPDSNWRPLLLKRLYPYLNLTQAQGLTYLKNFFGVSLDQPDSPFFSHFTRWQTTAQCKNFFSESMNKKLQDNAVVRLASLVPHDASKWHPFNRAQYVESKTLMAGYLLCSQGDRMLMANSVEGRFPYLDHRVIEFANSLHPRHKMRVLNEKYLLKLSTGRYLPKQIVKRHKQPYRAPDIPAFFSGGKTEYVDEMLSKETVSRYGYFDPEKVHKLHQKVRKGRAIGYKDNMAFVGILSTQLWHHHFIESFYKRFKRKDVARATSRVSASDA